MAPPRRALSSSAPLTLRSELARKALHLSAAIFPVAYALGVPRRTIGSLLAAISAIALLVEVLRRWNPVVRAMFERIFGSMMRGHERGSVTGATWLALSCLVAVVVLSRGSAIAALWCAAVGDPAATLTGLAVTAAAPAGRVRASGKTVAGSLGCLSASFVGVWMVAGYSPAVAAVVAIAAAGAEAAPMRIDDNVRVAAVAGAVAQLLT